MGYDAEPGSEDFNKITEVFDKAVADLRAAGAEIVDPVEIPDLKVLLAKRAGSFTDEEESFKTYMSRSKQPPYKSRAEAMNAPDVRKGRQSARVNAGRGEPAKKPTMNI